jgi:hypothetical protein
MLMRGDAEEPNEVVAIVLVERPSVVESEVPQLIGVFVEFPVISPDGSPAFGKGDLDAGFLGEFPAQQRWWRSGN